MRTGSRIAVVTGSASGIGLAIAERLAGSGVSVVGADIRATGSDRPGIHPVIGDLTSPGAVEALLAQPLLGGTVDYLVNAAGVALLGHDGPAPSVDEKTWQRVIDVNFGVTRRLCIAALPLLRRGAGRAIVNIASIAGLRNMDTPMDAYQVSKAAVVSFTRSLAEQLGPEGIRCNTICPGAILTPMVEPLYAENPQRRESMERRTPLGRLGTPTDIAAAAAFLLSEEASFITGADLVVDGGWTIQTV